MLRYFTTSFRIGEGRIELRRGLVNKHVLSTRLERVRTVEMTASPIQRLLGLTTVRVGTGTASTSGEDRLDLDGLPNERARRLRAGLLHAAPVDTGEPPDGGGGAATGAGGAAPGPGLGALRPADQQRRGRHRGDPRRRQPGARRLRWRAEGRRGRRAHWVGGSWWLALVAILVLIAAMSVLAVAGYLVSNWGFTLTHAARDGSWHLRRGLFTTRETSLDDERVSGVSIGEPIGLRLARGGRLSAIVTGLDRRQSGSSMLVPPAPQAVVASVAGQVLGTDEPVTTTLRSHGRGPGRAGSPAPWCRLRAGARARPCGRGRGADVGRCSSPWLLPAAAAALAVDRVRSLGHTLTERHFVARSGSLYRQRQALETTAIIGWNFRSTWFQRRAGLTTLGATTAGGSQSVTALDVPEPDAVAVSSTAVPGLVDQFLASG